MRRPWRWLWTLPLGALALVACGAFDSEDGEAKPAAPAADAGADASSSSSSGAVDSGDLGKDANPPPPPCDTPVTMKATIEADVSLTDCNGTIVRGAETFVHLGVGSALLRFNLSPSDREKLKAAVAAKKNAITEAVLTLHDDSSCDACGSTALPAEPGTISVHGARVDWQEGTNATGNGPDRCRRVPGPTKIGWGKDDPTASLTTEIASPFDFDEHANTAPVVAGTPLVSIGIAPEDIVSRGALESGLVAFYIERMDPGRFLFGSHENARNGAREELSITFCPAE